MNKQVAANLDKIITALDAGDPAARRDPPVHPDPLSEAAARRHELTRAEGRPGPAELDRAGAPVTFAGVAQAALLTELCLEFQQFSG